MKRTILLAMFATLVGSLPLLSSAQVQLGVNVTIGAPNYYGQIDVENGMPPPAVLSPAPIVVQPAPMGVYYPPVYLRVPYAYTQNWAMYCGYYNACYMPVFFVQDAWYINVFAPRYRYRYPHGRPGFQPRVYYNPRYVPMQRVEIRREDRHEGSNERRREDHHDERR